MNIWIDLILPIFGLIVLNACWGGSGGRNGQTISADAVTVYLDASEVGSTGTRIELCFDLLPR